MTKDEREILLDYFQNVMLFPQPLDNSVYSCEKSESIRNAIITLIEELKQEQESTTKNDLAVDCISRQEVLNIAKASKSNWIDNSILFKRVNELPSITPQAPKTGHWIYLKHNKAKCSECDDVVLIAQTYGNANYCPNCGARMIESQESEGKE